MALIIKRKTPVPDSTPVQLVAPDLPKPKIVLKFGGAKKAEITTPADTLPMTERQQQKLVDSGLMEATEKKWGQLMLGDRVTITNTMFPWVKHYKPGDQGLITHISPTLDPMGLDNSGKYHLHVIAIDMPKDASRKGQTAALFRWEFEKSSSGYDPALL